MVTNNSANTYIVPTANHEVTQPLQPAFLAYLASYDNNRTGTGTIYTLGTNVAFTEVFDQNADFNTNGTFTASVTGRYLLILVVKLVNTNTSVLLGCRIISSNRLYYGNTINVSTQSESSVKIQTIADMDASDTVAFATDVYGLGGDTADIAGGSTLETFVCGTLLA